MRPDVLSPLFAALTSLPGIGPKVEKLYARLFGREHAPRILDLLFHLPTGYVDRRARPKLRDVVPDSVVTVSVTVGTFDEWWRPYELGVGPAGAYVAQLGEQERSTLRERCREVLPAEPIMVEASAWCVRAVA